VRHVSRVGAGYELRQGLLEAAKVRGEDMSKDEANYSIDKGLAAGVLDGAGNLNLVAKGGRQ
jgi:hypothetical protein